MNGNKAAPHSKPHGSVNDENIFVWSRGHSSNWQSDMLRLVATEAAGHSDLLALTVRGSYHRKAGLNHWSDLDLGVVMTDQAYLCCGKDAVSMLLPSASKVWCSAINSSLRHVTHRYVYRDLRRLDIVVVPAQFLVRELLETIDCTVVFERFEDFNHQHIHIDKGRPEPKSDPFEPASAPRQLSDIANSVKFDAQLALFRIARLDILEHMRVRLRIRHHIMEMARRLLFDSQRQIGESVSAAAVVPDPSVEDSVRYHVSSLMRLVDLFAQDYCALTDLELDIDPLNVLADEVVRACPDFIAVGAPENFHHWHAGNGRG